jgi:HlyD family secretion protein
VTAPIDLQSLKIERRSQPARTRRRRWPVRGLLLAAVAGLGWLFWPQLRAVYDRLRLPLVRTLLVTETSEAKAAEVRGTAANGYIVAARRAALSSDVPGRIVEMAVKEGSVVKQGDIVARLFADEYRAALQRAAAEVAAAESAVRRAVAGAVAAEAEVAQAATAEASALAQREEAAASLQFLELECERSLELSRTNAGSPRDVDRTRSERDAQAARLRSSVAAEATAKASVASARSRAATAGAEVEVAKAQVATAIAARDLAKATLDKTDVRAPFDGIVVLKDAEVGEVVSPNVQGGSNARGAVCTLVDFDSLEVQANVPETTLGSVQLGAPADVFLDAYSDERYTGVVDRIWPTADRQKATVEVRVRLERKDERLRPEMGVRIVFRSGAAAAPAANTEPVKSRILVPNEVLCEIDGKTGAFVIEGDTVRFALLVTGERKGGRVAIDQGLRANQLLVLDPPPSLRDGGRIRKQAN